ncbi:hypothetical protein [Gluconobacter cerinus]|uniref:hypothetical protein n=1 Tax=Gluconobacter cerinus TaxID=38307 RepID=UPI001B8B0F7D|nr:hypothetical protein [Gluconobacter cerinus]MBS0995112.1 hypothetical protein [Gluconobacter cerinus]
MAVPQYSNLFTCLHDEPEPVGGLGRGTHYSIFRCVEWLDVERRPLQLPQIHDFAVVWDEDHDTRIIEAIERIYMAGLLSPVQFIGERKGLLTVIVAARFYFLGGEEQLQAYRHAIEAIADDLDDPWTVEIGSFDRQPSSPHQTFPEAIISDNEHRVRLYLANIDSLWSLGTRAYRPSPTAPHLLIPAPSSLGVMPNSRAPRIFPPGGVLPPTGD